MIRKYSLILTLALIVTTTLTAQTKKDTLPPFIGISYIPSLNWKIFVVNTSDGDYLKYKFDLNSMSSVEGNYAIQKIGLRFGLSANFENNYIGKAYQYAGYLNLKGFWLRIQSTKVSGVVNWSGELPAGPGYFASRNFSNKYFNIEILKSSKGFNNKSVMDQRMGFYFGLGYTSMGFPLKMSTLTTPGGRENQKFGKPAYDTLFTTKFYSACFGWNMLHQLCMSGGKTGYMWSPAKPFAVYANTQDKLGFGTGTVSNYGKSMAEALNPGYTFVNSKGFTVLVHYSLSLGLRYYRNAGPVFLLFAAGYDLEGAAILGFGGAADTNKDLGYDTNFFYLNHGVSFKLYISWMGSK
ncbi:MAG: hypothetical protein HY958_11780 [Bacteroidia bacterium]|nr:hypothetical protein [Bacteroidia bacterium]